MFHVMWLQDPAVKETTYCSRNEGTEFKDRNLTLINRIIRQICNVIEITIKWYQGDIHRPTKMFKIYIIIYVF